MRLYCWAVLARHNHHRNTVKPHFPTTPLDPPSRTVCDAGVRLHPACWAPAWDARVAATRRWWRRRGRQLSSSCQAASRGDQTCLKPNTALVQGSDAHGGGVLHRGEQLLLLLLPTRPAGRQELQHNRLGPIHRCDLYVITLYCVQVGGRLIVCGGDVMAAQVLE